jgi:hypothetical protein
MKVGSAWVWWMLLYYPVMFAVIFAGKNFTDRYPENSPQRSRAEMALGCALLAMPSAPAVVFAVWFVSNAWSDPVLSWIVVWFALLFMLAFFYGAMANWVRFREVVLKLLSPFSAR